MVVTSQSRGATGERKDKGNRAQEESWRLCVSHIWSSSCLCSAYMKERQFYSCSSSHESGKRMKGGEAETSRASERDGISASRRGDRREINGRYMKRRKKKTSRGHWRRAAPST